MKYIRTKDGRIVEESNLEPGFRQTIITIKNKKDNKVLRQIVCNDLDDSLEMIAVGEYCKSHKINPKDINYERKILLNDILKQADTIEELIQPGDIVFYWVSSDDKEHCVVMTYDFEFQSIQYNAITKLLIPVGEDYKCVAKGYPSFRLIKGRRYLVNKGKLELL